MIEVPVLIAGGGPIGLTLGHELSLHGVRCMVVERNPSTTRHPKMDLTNSRSMELYARMGLSDLIRKVGVPPENNFDVAWITGLSGYELHRFKYPSQQEMWERIRRQNDGSMPAEPPIRISQIVLEPALKEALEAIPTAEVRFGWALESFVQDEDGVTCTIRDSTGQAETVRAAYLVGCDGGNSIVRRTLGIELDGTPAVRSSYMIHFRSRAYDVLQRWGITWHYQAGRGTLVAQDDKEYWTLQLRAPTGVDPATIDPRKMAAEFLGEDIEPEILVANPWSAHLLVAQSCRQGRVFLAGDSAHQFVPTGGYGMNTGVGDAVDLGWKLSAVLQNWGGPELLSSYEIERRPVALRNAEAARANLNIRFQIADLYAAAPDIDADTPVGSAQRTELAAAIAEIGNAENENWGIEYGFRYADSPIVNSEAGTPPAFDPAQYEATTWPGTRLPSVVLEDGQSLYRKLGQEFTLLAIGDAGEGDILDAAAALAMPVTVLRLPAGLKGIYQRNLILVRPDHHVAWRGEQAPEDWRCMLNLARGYGSREI